MKRKTPEQDIEDLKKIIDSLRKTMMVMDKKVSRANNQIRDLQGEIQRLQNMVRSNR